MSTVPASCCQTESTVLSAPIDVVWAKFRDFKLEHVAPGYVASTQGEANVGSVVLVTYKDGSNWECRITELSDRNHTIAYQVVSTSPSVTASSIEGELVFERISDGDSTFLKWSTEFSNDADAQVIADQKYKKLDCFKEFKKNVA